jgi:glycosyltransferase involved in cell wall biosynthesis
LTKLIEKEKPDVILSFMWYPNATALFGKLISRTKVKLIISERTSTFIYEGHFLNFLRNLAIRFLYPKADKIIFPSQDMANKMVKIYWRIKKKVNVIPNPVDIATINERTQATIEDPVYQARSNIIIAIGRISKEKGFSYLIRSISLLSKKSIDCKLVILGEGAESKNLQNLSKKLGVEDRVHFLGFKSNPYKYLACSTIFVLSSLYEGFPNVLLEAMALGVPSIATRCPTGPEEIITDEVDGILVPSADEKALANAIKKLLLDKDLRKRLSEAARKKADNFRVEKIIKQYEDVIDNVCSASAEN